MKHAPADVAPALLAHARPSSTQHIADFVALTKPRLNMLVVATSAAGYYLGHLAALDWVTMAHAAVGTALVAGGAAALNQVYERDTDALMRRTRMRPLPDGRVTPAEALWYGLLLCVAGLLQLAVTTNVLAAGLALATLVTYIGVYTPLKRRSALATIVGAVPGALPPMIGWAAARGSVSIGAWVLFAIVFLWQLPHFMAITWMYRDDYGKAGFPMLPVIEPDGRRTGREAVTYAAALVPASLAPAIAGVSGPIYFGIAIALGLAFLALAVRFASARNDRTARGLFYGSITYLPLLWIAMIADKL